MLLWRERLLSVPVMSLQTGARLAMATEPIIDPHDLKIVAFYCEGPLVDFSPAVLHVDDIREFGSMGMIIDDSDKIMPLTDLVRLEKVVKLNFDLIDKKVIDTTKRKIGKVNNYVVDMNSFYIAKFSVKKPLLSLEGEVIIDRHQIRKITNTEIIVEAPTVTETSPAVAEVRQAAIDNPFRQHRPAENSKTR